MGDPEMKDSYFFARKYLAPFVGATLGALLAFWVWPSFYNYAWPGENYYELHSVNVSDTVEGRTIPVRVVRQIHKQFSGYYNVSIRKLGESPPVCNGGFDVEYKTTNDMVVDTDLKWWTAGAVPDCVENMPPGTYIMSTCIYVKSPFRGICTDSNVFRILPDPSKTPESKILEGESSEGVAKP